MSKTYGANGGVTRVKVTGLDFDEIRDLIRTKPDQVTQQIANGLDQIGQDAVADIPMIAFQSNDLMYVDTGLSGGRHGKVRGDCQRLRQ